MRAALVVDPPASFVPVALAGKLFSRSAAQQVGLVDEVVAPAQLLPRAIERARELASVPSEAFAQVKLG